MNDIEDFLFSKYLADSSKNKNLQELFYAYRSPSTRNTQVKEMDLAALYMIARGRPIMSVMAKIIKENLDFFRNVRSVVDYGGGPGTFLFALSDFIKIKQYTNVEWSREFITLSKTLAKEFLSPSNPDLMVDSICKNYLQLASKEIAEKDLSIFSYTLCESDDSLASLVRLVEKSERVFILEPGTPLGFKNILQARDQLLEKEFYVVAPCTVSSNFCPLRESENDWCHFVERLGRSRIQMGIKKGVLGYEDEKYAYLLLSNSPFPREGKRIISRPKVTKYSLSLEICSEKERSVEILKKDDKAVFKAGKKSIRGDMYRSGA